MRKRKNAYELARSQVDTPPDIVRLFWRIAHRYRDRFSTVLDLGAGDGRFAMGGRFKKYVGVEIDKRRAIAPELPGTATVEYSCAFRHEGSGYSACIGNPPYVRHHDLSPAWRNQVASRIDLATGQNVNRKCNLYVYFLFLAILKSRADGLIATIVPYEWVSRPAASPLRKFIEENNWQVDTYRFSESVFPSVDTTAAISIIDKRQLNGAWRYFSINRKGDTSQLPTATSSTKGPIAYASRGDIWAMRGMSPGTQDVFTLTEGERIHAGLTKHDVYPCVTTFRHLPPDQLALTRAAFQSRFVDAGLKCWLIKSNRKEISEKLRAYLDSIPPARRATSTCLNRELWYSYALSERPDIFVSSGFTGRAPKVLINSIGAYAVGGIHGVYGVPLGSRRTLQKYLTEKDLSTRIVAHSGRLRKLEIKQLNSLLKIFSRKS